MNFSQFPWFKKRSGSSIRPGVGTSVPMGVWAAMVERLENRVLLASNITASISKGILTISGSTDADKVTIEPALAGGMIHISVTGGTVNGQASVDLAGLTKDVRVTLGGGNDQLIVQGLTLPKNLVIDLGDGSNVVDLRTLKVNGTTSITLGSGSDLVQMDDSQFVKKVTLKTGDGVDSVFIDRREGFAGLVQFNNKSSISLEGGNDAVRIGIDGDSSRRATAAKPMTVNGGDGSDTLSISTQSQVATKEKLVESHSPGTLPQLTADLANDTGVSDEDGLTSDPAIAGTVIGFAVGNELIGGFDNTPLVNYVDLSSFVQPNGSFTISRTNLETLFPGQVTDGSHTFHLQVSNAFGESSEVVDVAFVLDSGTTTPSLGLSAGSDSGATGDDQTSASIVTLVGQAEPGTMVTLVETGASTTASVSGGFQFSNVELTVGPNTLTARATDGIGNVAQQVLVVTRLNETVSSDIVLDWNSQTLQAIQRDGSDPLIASRILAMESLAVFDVLNAFDGTPGFYVTLQTPDGASLTAAVAAAAHRILVHEYPTQQAVLDGLLQASLSGVPLGQARTDGIAFGQAVADAVLALREEDGSRDFVAYIPATGPGKWGLTVPMLMPSVGAQWPDVTPFVIGDPEDFLPNGPPDLSSEQWATEFNQIKELGAADSTTRTVDQTQIARFWSDGQGTYTPPGHWNEIARRVALAQGTSTSANARMLAMLNLAMMDAGIVAWRAKYEFEFWRPITAIAAADTDGIAATTPDLDWQPLLGTPSFPDYVSGHSAFSGAAAAILNDLFGEDVSFSSTSIGLPNVTRNFTSFDHAADEAGLSRLYGGIHYLSSDLDGLAAGRAVGASVLEAFAGIDTQPPRIVLDDYPLASQQSIALTGHVLDTVSGVVELTARIDSGVPISVIFNPSNGAFSLPLNLATNGSADGLHHIVLVARDAVGNATDPLDLTFALDTSAPILTITSPTPNGQITEGLRLTGTVDGTSSTVVSLTYAFDDGSATPISFNFGTGAFDSPLNISLLMTGSHVMHVVATDSAGHSTSTSLNLNLAAALPLTIVDMEPLHGASEVGTTFHPKFTFSRPVNPATLTAANFHASVSGQELPINVVASGDGTSAWIFFDDPMPGGTTIQITVNGTGILGTDGTPLDADGNGTPGGTLLNTFRTVSTTGVQGTTIAGFVLDPGPDQIPHDFDDVRAGPDGIINTDDDVYLHPLAGVKVFVQGMEEHAVFTDATGHFEIDPAPTGNVKLVFQGGFATNAPAGYYFPEMVMDMESIPGIENWAMEEMPEFYLPRISTSVLHDVSNTVPTVIHLESIAGLNLTAEQAALVSMTVYPNSAVDLNGQVMDDVRAGISIVAADYVRMMLPNGVSDLPFSFTIQAPGVARFTTPVSLTIPNTFGALPGSQSQFISYDHATGLMAVEGTMTVSADGLTISTDPGVGITHPGWHFPAPPPSPPDDPDDPSDPDDSCPDCEASSNSIPPTQSGNNEYVLMYFPNTSPNPLAIRLRSDDGGHFKSIVPGGQTYQIYIYDPGSGLIATGTGTTPRDASRFDPTDGLSLHASAAPDTDSDGLPDDAEFAIGTNTASIDSDNDGINDLIEIQRNLDPLSNRPLTVGLMASLALNGEAKEIVVTGKAESPLAVTGFVATGSYGLAIVDLSEFRRPIVLSQLDLPGDATDVAADVAANIAVVASNAGGLHFINIADPLHPFLIRTLSMTASQVEISDGVVYVAVGSQLRALDEFTGDEIQSVTPGGGTITGITREGTLLYTMGASNLLRAIDTAGLTMTLRGSITLPHGGAKISVNNGIVYAAVGASLPQGGFVTANVANPNSLTLISDADNGNFGLGGNVVVANGSGLALLAGQALTFPRSEEVLLMDVSDATNTFNLLRRFVLPQTPQSLAIAAGLAFVADGTGGLQVINYRAFDALGQPPTATISTTVADADGGTPGIQVSEGSSIPIRVTATDDVQVRSVELLVNGVVQASDVQAPFDFFAIAPSLSGGGAQATIQARTTDTGGNSSLSNILAFGLIPDNVPPVVITSSPSNNGVAFDTNAISVRFNEALDPSLINLSGVTLINLGDNGALGGGDDSFVPLVSITAASPGRLVILPQAPLPKGKFQLVLNKSIISDVAGNDATANVTITFTNYINLAPGTVVWASDSNGAWENPANWSSGVVPGVNDNVLIDRIGANPIVTHASGIHTVRSLRTAESLVISGGSLTLNGGTTSLLQGSLTVSGDGSLVASGAATIVNATGSTNLAGGSVYANSGAVFNLSGATSFVGASFNTFIQTNNANSQINLPSLTTLTGGTGNAAVFVRAFSGGTVNLPSLTTVTGGSTQFHADVGTINAPLLTSFVDDSPNNGTSLIRVDAGGVIQFGNLTTLDHVDVQIGLGTLAVNQFTAITNSSISVEDGATATFTNLGTTTGSSFFASLAGILNLPAVTSYAGTGFNTFIQTNNANSQLNLPNLVTLSGGTGNAAVFVRGFSGGTVNLPALTSVTGGSTQFHVDVGTINAPLLTSFVDNSPNNGTSEIRVDAGGTIQFGNLTTLDHVDVRVGLGTLAVNQFTSITNSSISVEDGATATFTNLGTTTGSSFFASSAGILNLPAVTSYAGTGFNTFIQTDHANSQLNLPNLVTLSGGTGNAAVFVRGFSGGTVNLPALTSVTGGSTQFHADVGTINAPLLTSFVDDSPNNGTSEIRVDAGGTIQFGSLTTLDHVDVRVGLGTLAVNQFTAITNSSISVEDGATATFTNLGTTTGSSFFASSAGILNLPAVTSYAGTGFNTFIQTDHANSQLNLPNLVTLSGGTGNAAVFVRGFSGGTVNLPALTSVTGGSTQFYVDVGTINAPLLTSFVDNSPNNGTSEIRVDAGGTIQFGNMTTLNLVDLRLGLGTFAITHFTSIMNASVTIEDGRNATFTNLATTTGASFFARTGGILNLPAVTTYSGVSFNTFFQADDANSQVNALNLTTLHGVTGNAAVFVRSFSGGKVNLSVLTSIPDGAAQVLASGTGSLIDLSQLTTFIDSAAAASSIQAESGGTVVMPLLTNLQFLDLTLDGATSTMNTSQITNIDTVNVLADNNAVLNLLAVTSYTGSGFNTFLQSDHGGTLNLPNITTLHGGTSGAAVFVRAFAGGDINLSGLSSIPDGATQVLATGTGSSIDLSQLTTFIDSTSATSAIQAENGGNISMPLLTNLQFLDLTLDGATSTMNTSQITNIDTVNLLADNNAVLSLPGVTGYTGSGFNTFLQSDRGGTLNLPNITTLHGGTSGAAVFVRAFAGGDINLSGLSSIPDGAAQVLATGTGSSIDLSQLTTFIDSTSATSAIQAESGGNVSMPLLTNLQFVDLTLDGTTSSMNTNQITNIDTVNLLADNNAILSLPGVTSYTGSGFNTFLQSDRGGVLNLANLTTLHGGISGAAVLIRSFSGGDINLPLLSTIPDGAVQISSTDVGSVINIPQLATFTDTTAAQSLIRATGSSTIHLGTSTTTVTRVDVTIDTSSTLTVGTLVLSTSSSLVGTGTLTGNLNNDGGSILIGDSNGSNIGKLIVAGNYTQTAGGSITIQIGGMTAGTQFDQLVVNGSIALGGTLNLALANGFNPAVGNLFQILVSSVIVNGQFVTVNGTSIPGGKIFVAGYNPANVVLSVN